MSDPAPPASADSERIAFSGLLVTCNESRHLSACLESLSFCDEILVFDLGSTDGSTKIAESHGATVVHHRRVPIADQIRQAVVAHAKHDWVVFMDPEEVLPAGIDDKIRRFIREEPKVGSIILPVRNYFRGKPLSHTQWGREQGRARIHHRKRVCFSPHVHTGIIAIDGYQSLILPGLPPNQHLIHYWADSYRQLFEKHWRYIQLEGESRHAAGQRFAWHNMLSSTYQKVISNLFRKEGIRGGFSGIFLSFFAAWYNMMGWLSLRDYERKTSSTPVQT